MPTLDAAPALHAFIVAWTALLGAVVGSFLNVVIARLPAGLSVVRPRSRCPRCGTSIAWFDNVPVISWLLLRGRCRSCRAPISWRYPVVELAVAAIAVAAVVRHGPSPAALAELVFGALLVALAFIDVDTWLLPHALTWPLIALGLGAAALGVGAAPSLRSAALGAALGFAAFAAVSFLGEKVFRREALGFGDVWLLAGLGAWQGVGALVPIVLLASMQGAIVGVGLVLAGKGEPGPATPEPEPEHESVPESESATSAAPLTPTSSAHPERSGAERREVEGSPAGAGEREGAAPVADPTSTPTADASDLDEDWVPPKNAVPFGPFLALAALEWLYLGALLAGVVPALAPFR